MTRARFAALLLVLILGAASLAGFAPTPPLLDGVPDVVQATDFTCGPSALVAVLAYYGVAAEEGAVTREARTDPEIGAELEDLAEVARRRGLEADVREGLGLADLARELKAGRPVIVLNQSWREDLGVPWGREWDSGHYLVVIGMDPDNVYVEDPALDGARGFIPCGEFVERWHDWTIDKRKAWGQALLVYGRPPAPGPRTVRRFERVR